MIEDSDSTTYMAILEEGRAQGREEARAQGRLLGARSILLRVARRRFGPPDPAIQPDPDTQGAYCNPYGPCEEWCALFATWVWEAAGVPIPRYAFTGDIFNWAATNTAVTGGATGGQPGEIVLYGTGPASTSTSVHATPRRQVVPRLRKTASLAAQTAA